ncbi:MAG: amine oxidase, partial [Propionibacterium sp.]
MFDCLVIGAGLAGLAAGNELVRRGLNTMVLEARGRIGGRVENAELSDGEIVEMGGQWIGPGHEEMYELVSRYQLDLIDLPTEGEFTIRIQGRSLRVPSREGEPVMSPFEVADLG